MCTENRKKSLFSLRHNSHTPGLSWLAGHKGDHILHSDLWSVNVKHGGVIAVNTARLECRTTAIR